MSRPEFRPVGTLPPDEAAEILEDAGESEVVEALSAAPTGPVVFGAADLWPFQKTRAWQHSAHAFGYLPTTSADDGDQVPFQNARSVAPDPSLIGARIKITLDDLRVADYPGGGKHNILLEFAARNQVADGAEQARFALACRVQEGAHAGVDGWPIFVGLGVGDEGIALQCRTVNVSNEQDDELLRILDSDVFKQGLGLAATAQPAVLPLAGLLDGMVRITASRRKNVPVQEYQLGLDFSDVSSRAGLATGSYVAAQVSEEAWESWDWEQWVWDRRTGRIASRDGGEALPWNYMVLGVSRYEPG